MILYIIFYFSLGYTFWMLYEIIKYTQGQKIKAYWGRYNALQEAKKLEKELREARLLKQLEANKVEEIEAIPLEWDDVIYHKERPKRTSPVIVLEINAKPSTSS